MQFKRIILPDQTSTLIPDDITVVIPSEPSLSIEQRSRLAYIPWDEKYLTHVPIQYRDFFVHVLPRLHVRTTDVHTALSLSQLHYVAAGAQGDQKILSLAIMLHDVGWSEVSPEGIANSLAYSGLALSAASRAPKQQHVIFGESLAYKLLTEYPASKLQLSTDDIFTITEMIRRHDHDAPWEKGKFGPITSETNLLCDCDRLWSYTHENFWLDTVRKMVRPEEYINTIDGAIETYFFTPAGKARARKLVAKLRKEVSDYVATIGSTVI